MSIQSFITNLVLRHQFKRQGRGKLDVHKARHMVNKMAKRYPPPPRDIEHQPVAARPEHKLCAAEWLSVANPQRTIGRQCAGGRRKKEVLWLPFLSSQTTRTFLHRGGRKIT